MKYMYSMNLKIRVKKQHGLLNFSLRKHNRYSFFCAQGRIRKSAADAACAPHGGQGENLPCPVYGTFFTVSDLYRLVAA